MVAALKRSFGRKLDSFNGDFERAVNVFYEEMYRECDRLCFEYQVRVHNCGGAKMAARMRPDGAARAGGKKRKRVAELEIREKVLDEQIEQHMLYFAANYEARERER